MHRKNSVDFVNRFIDSVTIRPFLMDLRRMRRASQRFPMPSVPRQIASTEAA